MIKRIFKIDPLLLFLSLSLICLFSFVGDYKYFIPKTEKVSFKNYVPVKSVFEFPSQNRILNNSAKIVNYNRSFELFYSVNGGKSYIQYNDEDISSFNPDKLFYFVNSIRHKNTLIKSTSNIAILVKAKHKNNSIFTKPKQLTYFKNDNYTLPIVSLIVNQDDLFDEYSGIMTLGENSWQNKGFYKKSWFRNANYNQRGNDWLKKVYFQYFENKELKYETIAGIQISGHASRSFPQKSMKIKGTKAYGDNRLNYSFFGNGNLSKYNSIVLRNSGNDNAKTLFADLLMHNLIKNENVLSQKGKAVNVYLNGNYWGIYNLRERHNSYYIAKKEGVKSSDITVLEKNDGRLKSGNKKVQKEYLLFIDSLLMLDPKESSTYEFAKTQINFKSFRDYILIETFYGNGDWLMNNTLWYKAKNEKWKWLVVDLDNCLAYRGYNNINVNYFNFLKQSNSITSKLFNFLIQNPKFKNKLKSRAEVFVYEVFSDENIEREYTNLKEKLNPSIDFHLQRWRGVLSREKWEENCLLNLSFLKNRKTIFLNQVNEL